VARRKVNRNAKGARYEKKTLDWLKEKGFEVEYAKK